MKQTKWAAVVLVWAIASALPVAAAPAADFDPACASWGAFLDRFLAGGRVDYRAVKSDPRLLDQAVGNLERIEERDYRGWNADGKKAFWINAYNIAAVKVVVEHYPIERDFGWKALAYPAGSIQQIDDVWDRGIVRIMGRVRSLDGIEKGVLTKEFADPRIHFALVCASLGCPTLRAEPYIAARLDEQLEDQTARFLSDPRKARYDPGEAKLMLSPIFKWYREEFRRAAGSVAGFVKEHAAESGMKALDVDRVAIGYLDYDWSLNDASRTP